jgi:hypothetical protein
MKNMLKTCAILVMAFTFLVSLPTAKASNHNQTTGGQLLVAGGALSALVGALAWASAETENCRAGFASHSGRCVSTSTRCSQNPSAAVCTYTNKDDDAEKIGKGLVAGGVGAMVVGAVINRSGESAAAFNTRWYFDAVDGIPKMSYPISESAVFSFGMCGKALDYDGVSVGFEYSL